MDRLDAMLQALGIKEDAKFTAALSQQLEHVRSKVYDIKYPELKARMFIPVDNSVNPGAETVAYYQWDAYGMADIIANYATDLPMVSALAEKFTSPVEGLGQAYDYSIQDLRRSAMSGMPLEMKKAAAARRGVELRIDDIACTGNAKAKLPGFINNANVSVLAATSDGTSAKWLAADRAAVTDKAPADIRADIAVAIQTIIDNTKGVFRPNTMLLPEKQFSHLELAQNSAASDKTVLDFIRANMRDLQMIEPWYKLSTADAAGTGPRMVIYKRDPEVLELVIPQEFEQFPAQVKNLTFMVPCHARIGGVVVYQPLAIVFTDGL